MKVNFASQGNAGYLNFGLLSIFRYLVVGTHKAQKSDVHHIYLNATQEIRLCFIVNLFPQNLGAFH